MKRLSKEEFLRRALQDQKERKLKAALEKEQEIFAYLAEQKGKRKYALKHC